MPDGTKDPGIGIQDVSIVFFTGTRVHAYLPIEPIILPELRTQAVLDLVPGFTSCGTSPDMEMINCGTIDYVHRKRASRL